MKTSKPGLYANINAKQDRIKAGSGEKMNKVGSKAAPSKQDFVNSAKTAKKASNATQKVTYPCGVQGQYQGRG